VTGNEYRLNKNPSKFKLNYKSALSHNIVHVTSYNLGSIAFKCKYYYSLYFECEKKRLEDILVYGCGNGNISLLGKPFV
jgi:hypothetical protein